jgi:hypothetical protein
MSWVTLPIWPNLLEIFEADPGDLSTWARTVAFHTGKNTLKEAAEMVAVTAAASTGQTSKNGNNHSINSESLIA